jgi:CTP synthase
MNEALEHAGIFNNTKVKRVFVDADELEKKDDISSYFDGIDGILIPGGFGERGTEGKIRAVNYARLQKIPFFGICLGLQMAVIEYARSICNLKKANSTEFIKECEEPVIDYLPEQKNITRKGGTMRLGAYRCTIAPGTNAERAYDSPEISERHRHRYEVNPAFEKIVEDAGLIISGRNPESSLVEIIELNDHPWFLGCQFHPEFKSKPMKAHPLFRDFIKASLEYRKQR